MKKLFRFMMWVGILFCVMGTSQEVLAYTEGSGYSVSGTTYTVTATSGDITDALDTALWYAGQNATSEKEYTVKLKANGTYYLSSNVHIYSNTILDLNGSTLVYKGTENHNMLMLGTNSVADGYMYKNVSNYNSSTSCAGYAGFENVTIKNGTFESSSSNESTIIRMAHATNVTLSNVTLSGGGCEHQIEVAAIDGFFVTGCTFKDFGDKSGNQGQEALQLDIPCSEDVFKDVYLDGTPMQNVEITECTFSNVPRGVGTHTQLYGTYHENIKINNNTFNNVWGEAILALTYHNCEIKNNKINNCGAGIVFQYFKNEDDVSKSLYYYAEQGGYKGSADTVLYDAASEISGNTITVAYTVNSISAWSMEVQGIHLIGRELTKAKKSVDGGTVPKGDYYVTGVTVKDNKITTAGHGIHLTDAQSCTVTGNTIVQKNVGSEDDNQEKYDGIIAESGSQNSAITKNTISDMVRNGIFVQNSTVLKEVTGNTISSCTLRGISFYNESGCTEAITGNTITGCTAGGIMVSTDSTTAAITSNKMTDMSDKKTTSNGILIFNNSTVDGDISGNTISGAYGAGISISGSAAVTGSISGNTIKKSAKHGIFVYSKSTVGKNIENNTITNSTEDGIYITNTGKVKGSISGNTITTAKMGICLYKKSTVSKNIENNIISSTKSHGIYLSNTGKVKGSISSNKITSAGGRGIYLYKNSTVTAITGNTIKKAGNTGISIKCTSNDMLISGNKISGGAADGILVETANKNYTITITDNTITAKKKYCGIKVQKENSKISISGNTVSKAKAAVYVTTGVKGKIYANTCKNVTTQVYIAGTQLKTTGAKLAVKSVTSPAKKQMKVKWAKVSDAEGYEIQYSTTQDFSSGVKSVTISSGSTTNKVIKKLKSGKTYYVRVSSYKTVNGVKVYSAFGKAKKIKVK